jgi:hypothetical protein
MVTPRPEPTEGANDASRAAAETAGEDAAGVGRWTDANGREYETVVGPDGHRQVALRYKAPDLSPPWRPTWAELRDAAMTTREHWLTGNSLYPYLSAGDIAQLWNGARMLGTPPPMPAPFPGASSNPQEGLAALDLLLRWLNRASPDNATAPAARAPAGDGPVAPDGLVWGGVLHHGLSKMPYAALAFLWARPNRTADVRELAGPVWGDSELLVPDNGPAGLRRAINAFFVQAGIPLHARERNGYLSIADGPPAAPRKAPTKTTRRRR